MAEAGVTATGRISPAISIASRPRFRPGTRDLRALGFWRIVAKVKPDRILVDRYADQIGRIDAAAFRLGVERRVPVWVGNALLLVAALAGLAAAIAAQDVSSTTARGAAVARRRRRVDGVAALARRTGPWEGCVGVRFHRLLHRRPPATAAGPQDRLRHVSPRRSRQPRVDARFGSDHDEGRAVLRAGVLARIGRTVVERGGVGRDRRRVDRDGRRVLGQGQRLEEVPSGTGRREGSIVAGPLSTCGRPRLYSSTNHRGARGYRAERPAARAGDPQDLNRLMPAEGVETSARSTNARVYVVTSGAFGPGRDHRTIARSAIGAAPPRCSSGPPSWRRHAPSARHRPRDGVS